MNLFDFDYDTTTIQNADGSDSRFQYVIGDKGMVVHAKKTGYEMIPTSALSLIGDIFKEKGKTVTPYVHKFGEVIGLSINLGERMTKVGDKTYRALLHVPNNGTGAGHLMISEVRLVCTNGMVRKNNGTGKLVTIPHNITYPQALKLVEVAIDSFVSLVRTAEENDEALNAVGIDKYEAKELLNKWFYRYEMPESHKKDLTETQFRAALVEMSDDIPTSSQNRYKELQEAFDRELGYNEQLGLSLSKYTVFAAITNYLSRRLEKSGSAAPKEVKQIRQEKKTKDLVTMLIN